MLETIEEAWAILAERCWWRSRTDGGDQGHVGAEKKAARALALASHAAGCRWTSRETGIFCGRGWSCAVRARIEALGG